MSQQQVTPELNPREFAKARLRPYVLRGDSLESLREGDMGWYRKEGNAEIHLDTIRVMDNDWHVVARFKLAELYREIQTEAREQVTQGSLFDMEAAQ